MAAEPIADNLIGTDAKGPYLIGGRRKADGRIVFPLPAGSEGAQYEAVPLSREGTLWSYTVQRFRPKSPPYAGADDERSFQPFALGYVELPGEVIVETRIAVEDPATLRIGMAMEFFTAEFPLASGRSATTYAFAPKA